MRILLTCIYVLSLIGCASHASETKLQSPFVVSTRKDNKALSNINRVRPTVSATFGFDTAPEVIKAYNDFTQHGVSTSIHTEGFKTVPYSPYRKMLIVCAPLRLCIIQLQKNELINHLDIGDSIHWIVSRSMVGEVQDGSYQIVIKPKMENLATDLVITTNKRTYQIGLVSKKGAASEILSFYYPMELNMSSGNKDIAEIDAVSRQKRSGSFPFHQLNFNYLVRARGTELKPIRVFDDHQRVYIQMPDKISRQSLPLLYLSRSGKPSLTNYQFKYPYYIVNSLFDEAYLVTSENKKIFISRGELNE